MIKTDPVCGQSIDPLRARAIAIVAGERYYFCSVEHKARFAEDPRRYLPDLQGTPEIVLEPEEPPVDVIDLLPETEAPLPAPPRLLRFEIGGMVGPEDAERVRRAIRRVTGVQQVEVDAVTEIATAEGTDELSGLPIIEAVSAAGYEAIARPASPQVDIEGSAERARELGRRAVVALAAAAALAAIGAFCRGWAGVVVAAGAVAVGAVQGRALVPSALARLRRGRVTGELLALLGAVAAFAGGLLDVFAGHDARLAGASAGLVAVGLAARWLEERARHAIGMETARPRAASPAHARRVRPGPRSEIVKAGDLLPGELVRVVAGEVIPVDGVVKSGEGAVDESPLSGRARSARRGVGDAVHAGTTLVQGSLVVTGRRAGRETALARLDAAVAEAQGSRTPLHHAAERAAAWVGPAVLVIGLVAVAGGLAGGTGAAGALALFAAVVGAVAPAGLGLATQAPLALTIARAARQGILFRNAEGVERAAEVQVVAVDKTGALSSGRPRVVGHLSVPDGDEGRMLALAAAAERLDDSPLAQAVRAYVEGRGLPVPPVDRGTFHPGLGVTAAVAGAQVVIGSRRLLEREGIAVPEVTPAVTGDATPVQVAVDGRLVGSLAVADPVRGDAAEWVARVHRTGRRVVLVTGDAAEPAGIAASRVGIHEVHADLRPDEKKLAVVRLRDFGGPVAALGHGAGDAPALAAADLGIALRRGGDPALEAGGMAVLGEDLDGIPDALILARRAVRTMRTSFAVALGGSIVLLGIALAMPWGRLTPLATAALSTVVLGGVVRNALGR